MALIVSDEHDPDMGTKVKRGGKMTRSETVTVRLDPRLNYLSDLAARAQRRTKSSFIEWAVEAALKSVAAPNTGNWDKDDLTIDSLASQLWDVDEADRLVALAFHAPNLMTHEEQVLWKLIREHGYFWRGRWERDGEEEEWRWHVIEHSLIMDRLRKHFEHFKAAARGDGDINASDSPIPKWQRTRSPKPDNSNGNGYDDLDDDIPF